ncbi:hypothetical protein C8Q73DRAFT_663997 [Cubamyces lactineus]|nr:hypothetical protein C8Q73DRAFT_663997 [Cubamyces lactineus]
MTTNLASGNAQTSRTPIATKTPPSALVSKEARARRFEEIVKGVQEGRAVAAENDAAKREQTNAFQLTSAAFLNQSPTIPASVEATPTPAPKSIHPAMAQGPLQPVRDVQLLPAATANSQGQPMDLDTYVLSDNSAQATPRMNPSQTGVGGTIPPLAQVVIPAQPTPPPFPLTTFSFVTPLSAADMKAKDPRPRKRARELSPEAHIDAAAPAASETSLAMKASFMPDPFNTASIQGLGTTPQWTSVAPAATHLHQNQMPAIAQQASGGIHQQHLTTSSQTPSANAAPTGHLWAQHPFPIHYPNQMSVAIPNTVGWNPVANQIGTNPFPHPSIPQPPRSWVPYDPYNSLGPYENTPLVQRPLYVLGQNTPRPTPSQFPVYVPRCDANTVTKDRVALLNSMGYPITPAPEGGFKLPQMADPGDILRMAHPHRNDFNKSAEPRRFAVQVQEKVTADNAPGLTEEILKLIAVVTGEQLSLRVVTQPPPTLPKTPDFDYAATWLLHDLSEHAVRVLTEQAIWSTPAITAYVYGNNAITANPSYVMTLIGLCHNIGNMAVEGLRRLFHSATIVKLFVKAMSGFYPNPTHALQAANILIDNVRFEPSGTELGEERVTVAIYVDCPEGMDEDLWRQLKTDLRRHVYHVQGNTPAKARPHERCRDCHGVDHNASDCKLKQVPGWHGGSTFDVYQDTRKEDFDIDGHPGTAYLPYIPPPPYPGLDQSQHAPRIRRGQDQTPHGVAPGPHGNIPYADDHIIQGDRVWRDNARGYRDDPYRRGPNENRGSREDRPRRDGRGEGDGGYGNYRHSQPQYDVEEHVMDPKGKGVNYGKKVSVHKPRR